MSHEAAATLLATGKHGDNLSDSQNSILKTKYSIALLWNTGRKKVLKRLLFSRSLVSNSLWPHGLQHASLPVLYYLLELAQSHVHWVSDAIHRPSSHPLSSPSPPALSLSQHQGLFQWICSSQQLAKLLELQLQHQFFQRIFRVDFL